MIIKMLLNQLVPLLEEAEIENPLRELRIIIAHVLKKSYEEIFFGEDTDLTQDQITQIRNGVTSRQQGMPLAKIIGKKEFWGLPFWVTNDTLDPRPDSETLIETVLQLYPNRSTKLNVLDLGTGTGCLLLSVLHEFPQAKGLGIDFSEKALTVAKKNAETLDLAHRCQFLQSNWFNAITGQFDLILSNPPYIPPETPLSKETLYDPVSALFAAENGLLHYRLILEDAHTFLKPLGHLVFEIGAGQESDVINLALKKAYNFLTSQKDLVGHTRCLVFQKSI